MCPDFATVFVALLEAMLEVVIEGSFLSTVTLLPPEIVVCAAASFPAKSVAVILIVTAPSVSASSTT